MRHRAHESIRQYLGRFLFEAGLWADQVEIILASIDNPALTQVWNQQCGGFPDHFICVAQLAAQQAAIRWIDANQPDHIARFILGAEVVQVGTFGPGGEDTPNMMVEEGGGVGN